MGIANFEIEEVVVCRKSELEPTEDWVQSQIFLAENLLKDERRNYESLFHNSKQADDIEAVKQACQELGLILKGKGNVRYYYSTGINLEADYVIEIPGCPYDVGLVKDVKTGTYNLVYDKFQGHVEKILGKDCGKLVQSAIYHKVSKHARLKGFFISKKMNEKNGNLEIVLQK